MIGVEIPRTAQILANYTEYTGLQEWEALNARLANEALPVKRTALSDYVKDTCGEASVVNKDWINDSKCVPQDAHCAIPYGNGNHDYKVGAMDSNACHGKTSARCLDNGQQDIIANALTHQQDAATDMSSRGVNRKEMPPLQLPKIRRNLNGPSSARVAGGMCVGLGGPLTAGDIASPRIRTIHAGELKSPSGRLVDRRPQDRRPQVIDKERQLYPKASVMRPALQVNTSNKKRLNELLQLDVPKIIAEDVRPSRASRIVPSQNLRIM